MSTLEVFEGGSINPKPEVSIIVPAYKVAPFIDETLALPIRRNLRMRSRNIDPRFVISSRQIKVLVQLGMQV